MCASHTLAVLENAYLIYLEFNLGKFFIIYYSYCAIRDNQLLEQSTEPFSLFLTELHPESLFSQITVLNASLDGELWPTRKSLVISLPNELLGYSKAVF